MYSCGLRSHTAELRLVFLLRDYLLIKYLIAHVFDTFIAPFAGKHVVKMKVKDDCNYGDQTVSWLKMVFK